MSKYIKGPFVSIFASCYTEVFLQHYFDLINVTLYYIKWKKWKWKTKEKGKEENRPKTFCMHLDTSESILKMKVLGQSKVESRCYS